MRFNGWRRRPAETRRVATANDLGIGGQSAHKALFNGLDGGIAPTNSTIASFERLLAMLHDGGNPAPGTPLYVSVEQAMRLAVVYRCVALVAGHVMQCPIRLYESVAENGKRRLEPTMGDLEWTLNTRPEARFSGPSMLEFQTASMLLYGDGYSEVVRDEVAGEAVGLLQYHPTDVQCGQNKANGRLAYAMTRRNADGSQGETVYRDQEDVIDWQNTLHNGFSAPSTIRRAGASAVVLGQSLEGSMHKFLQEGNLQKLILRHDGEVTTEQLRTFLETWRDSYGKGIDGRNIPVVLNGNWQDPTTVSVSPEDAQMLEMRQFGISDLGRLFGVPDIMLNQSEKASSWGSGTLVIIRNFMRTTINPILRRYEAELSAKLAPFGKRLVVQFDTSGLLRASATERASYNRAALGGGQQAGWMSVNEVRETEGLPPKEGEEYDNIHISGGESATAEDEDDEVMDELKRVNEDKDANTPPEEEQDE